MNAMTSTARPPLPDFDEGIEIHLTAHQRRFIAARLVKSLNRARANQARIEAKYGAPGEGMSNVIRSLRRLGLKVGLTEEVLDWTGDQQ